MAACKTECGNEPEVDCATCEYETNCETPLCCVKKPHPQLQAAENMDWQQVVFNGGPPCFHLSEDGRFCGRAERWHDGDTHKFISLSGLLKRVEAAKGEGIVDETLPPIDSGPSIGILVRVSVPENWETRLDMQLVLEREIKADRWNWDYPEGK